ncbi:MAG: hypothetical protein OXL34_08445 [Gemmatimonadota bacterium]|nr:hypothetical protein [Gemmatimonadota bacterium]
MNRRLPTVPVVLASLAFYTACHEEPDPPATPPPAAQLRDSAGILIAENPPPPEGTRLGWEIGPQPTMTIGAAEGEAPYLLHNVRKAATLSDGRIVVADGASNEVRVFDRDGVHLVSWGGEGEGPGEFDALRGVARWRGDSVAAWDSYIGRGLSISDGEGNLNRKLSLGSEPICTRIAVLRAGVVLRNFRIQPAPGPGTIQAHSRYDILDGDGAITASLGTHATTEHFRYDHQGMVIRGDMVFSRSVVTAAWGDLAVVSPNHHYEIRAYTTDGALLRIVRVDRPLIPATRSLLKLDFEDMMRHQATWLDEEALKSERERVGGYYDAMPVPETLPAFDTIMADALDHLWVREYPLPGRDSRWPREIPHTQWLVFDPDGRVLGFVEAPRGLVIYEIGADYVLGRRVGDLEVEYVEVWPLRRGP